MNGAADIGGIVVADKDSLEAGSSGT